MTALVLYRTDRRDVERVVVVHDMMEHVDRKFVEEGKKFHHPTNHLTGAWMACHHWPACLPPHRNMEFDLAADVDNLTKSISIHQVTLQRINHIFRCLAYSSQTGKCLATN